MRVNVWPLIVLLVCWLICPHPAEAAQPNENCIILVQNEPGLLTRQAEKLHQLIDLLPDDCRLGVGFCGLQELIEPAPLTLQRRADLHAALQTSVTLAEATEREWLQLVSRAIVMLPNGRLNGNNRLILVQSSMETKSDWSDSAVALNERQVQVVVLTEQLGSSLHPLVKQAGGQQWVMDGNLLSTLAQQLGMGSGELTQAAMGQGAVVQSFHLDEAVRGFVLMVERALPEAVMLLSPAGQPLTAGTGLTHCLTTPAYTSLHVMRPSEVAGAWSGDWQLTVPTQANASLWLIDPVQLIGAVTADRFGRVVMASIWRGGERLAESTLGADKVFLRSQAQEILALNDFGLNGDQTAGDGIFSAHLPDWLHPLAGTVLLEVKGYVYRSAELLLPRVNSAIPPSKSLSLLPSLAIAAALVGAGGLLVLSRPKPASWQLQHQSPGGYSRRACCGSRALYAGSGEACGLRLSAATGKRHLRLSTDATAGLILEVLQAEPVTLVNGERVYLRQRLQHGDLVQVAGDQLLAEQRSHLRSGRRRLGQSGRDLTTDGQSNRETWRRGS